MRGCCSKTTPRARMAYETASIASLLQYGMDLDSLPALLAGQHEPDAAAIEKCHTAGAKKKSQPCRGKI